MKNLLLIGAFASLSFGGGIPSLTVPIRIDSALIPKVAYIDRNNDSIKAWTNIVKDTLNRRSDTVAYYLDGSGGKTGTGSVVKATGATVSNLTAGGTTTLNNTVNVSGATASQALFTDGSKNVVSNAITGSGNVVMSTSPTITTPTISTPSMSSASITTATLNGTITNSGTISGGTVNPTTLQQGGVQAVTTTGTQTLTNKSISASQITAGTFGSGGYAFPSTLYIVDILYLEKDLALLNKAKTEWLTFASRNTSGSEAVFDLANVGTIATTGAITQNSVPVVTTTGSQTLTNKSLTAPALTGATTIASDSNGFYEYGVYTDTIFSGATALGPINLYFTRNGKHVTINGGANLTCVGAGQLVIASSPAKLPARLRRSSSEVYFTIPSPENGSFSVINAMQNAGGSIYLNVTGAGGWTTTNCTSSTVNVKITFSYNLNS